MVKRLTLIVAVLLMVSSATFAQWGSGWSGQPKQPTVITVGKTGAQYSVICGATCSSATSQCAPGSALASITDSSISKPYVVSIGPGVYDECVSVDPNGAGLAALTDISFIGAGSQATKIRPTVTTASDVAGGVFRISNVTTTKNSVRRIEVANLTIHNDAFGPPEAGFQIGKEGGPGAGNESPWTDVYIHDALIIGNHDGLQWQGTALNTATDVPMLSVWNTTVIGGDACAEKNWADVYFRNVECVSWTNYCESTDTTHLAARTGTALDGGSTTTFLPAAADANQPTNFWSGRRVVFSGGGGTCAAGATSWILSSTDTTLTFSPAIAFSPDSTCTYDIAAVGNAGAVPGTPLGAGTVPICNDIDWSVIRGSVASPTTNTMWKATGFHSSGTNSSVVAPDMAQIHVTDSSFKVYLNDFGPANGACTAGTQRWVSGFMASYSGLRRAMYLDNVDINVNVNADVASNTCAYPIFGFGVATGSNGFEDMVTANNLRINVVNTADPNVNIAGILVDEAAASPVYVPNAYISLKDAGASNNGTMTHLVQANSGVLTVGTITSDTAITTSGTIGYLKGTNRCDSVRSTVWNPSEAAGGTEYVSAQSQSGLSANADPNVVNDVVLPVAMTFNDLSATIDVAPDNGAGTQSKAITLQDNLVDTALTCTISEAATSCSYTGSPVTIAAGHKLNWKVVNTGTPAAAAELIVSVCASP